jgi:hypothetical protein
MSILPFFQWLDQTSIGEALRTNRALFPLVSTVHLLGLAMLVGTILVVDLGLLGIGVRRQAVSRIASQLQALTWTGLAVMLITGPILLMGEAIKLYSNLAFWTKLVFVVLALVFYSTVHRRAISDGASLTPGGAKSIGIVSLALWISAGLAAKSISAFMP